jgi:hypothetical protein
VAAWAALIAAAIVVAAAVVIGIVLTASHARSGPTFPTPSPTPSVTSTFSQEGSSFGPTTPPEAQQAGTSLAWLVGGIAGGVAIAGLLGWDMQRAVRLARGRGVGAARLDALVFELETPDVYSTGAGGYRGLPVLEVRPRPWRTASGLARHALWLVLPLVLLTSRLTLRKNERPRNLPVHDELRENRPGYDERRWNWPGYPGRIENLASVGTALEAEPIRLRWGGRPPGASADFHQAGRKVEPRPNPRPDASAAWWRRGRGTAIGLIGTAGPPGLETMGQPWERIVTASLRPEAAGRIEWRRVVAVPRADFANGPARSMLLASPAWTRALRSRYLPPDAVPPDSRGTAIGLCHVIGRAIDSAAGPVMEVGAEGIEAGFAGIPPESLSSSGARGFGVADLKRDRPAIVILQSEPIAVPAAPPATPLRIVGAPGSKWIVGGATKPTHRSSLGMKPPDDQAEKLRLGSALALDGVPAVLLLPVLPSAIMSDVAEIVTSHAKVHQGGDAEGLLARLRAAITPHVAAQALDDVVLFLNKSDEPEGGRHGGAAGA